jgi:aryl-alcohol dehydrogenase-like predicted oxidoreductase
MSQPQSGRPVGAPAAPLVPLGETGLRVSRVGIGAWQWGDRFYWGYGSQYGDSDLSEAFVAATASGINLVDTAEIYGLGKSERLVGQFISQHDSRLRSGEELVVATKFMPLPWRLRRAALVRALRGSLRRLGLPRAGLYQVHFPFGPRDISHWAGALADAHGLGLASAVGVSNCGVSELLRAHDALTARGVPLASNQVGYSLLNRATERSGLLDICRGRGITVIAYGPLAEGLLTGKYGPSSPPPLLRRLRYAGKWLPRLARLTGLLRDIGSAHTATPAQVALAWVIAKGALPVPGVKTAAQVVENAAAAAITLSSSETLALDAESDRLTGATR